MQRVRQRVREVTFWNELRCLKQRWFEPLKMATRLARETVSRTVSSRGHPPCGGATCNAPCGAVESEPLHGCPPCGGAPSGRLPGCPPCGGAPSGRSVVGVGVGNKGSVGVVGCAVPPCGGNSAAYISASVGVRGAATGAGAQRRVGAAGTVTPPACAIEVPPCGGDPGTAAAGVDVGSALGPWCAK